MLKLSYENADYNVPEETDEQEVKMTVAAILSDKGIISSGQAADSIGISKREFIEKAVRYGISVFGETIADLNTDMNV